MGKRGGGVAVYCREDLKFSDHKFKDFNISNANIEMQWISLHMDNLRPIVIVNIYRPPQGDYKVFCKELSNRVLNANLAPNTELYIMGDFNIDYNDKGTREYSELSTTTRILGLRQYISGPTRLGKTKDSCLDLIFTNSDCVRNSGVINANISDHLPVFITRKKNRGKTGKIEFSGRSYQNYDRERFQANLLERNWEPFYRETDPNIAWGVMKTAIEEETEIMCPTKKYSVKSYDDPWITREIIELIHDKDRLLRAARTSGDEEDWKVARRARNVVTGQIRNLKAEFLKEEQRQNLDNPKKFWRNISAILPNKRKGKREIILAGDEGFIKAEESAEKINEFFTNIGPNLAGDFDPEKWAPGTPPVETTIEDKGVEWDTVRKLCKEIKVRGQTKNGFLSYIHYMV